MGSTSIFVYFQFEIPVVKQSDINERKYFNDIRQILPKLRLEIFFTVSGNWHDKKPLRNFGTCHILGEKVFRC